MKKLILLFTVLAFGFTNEVQSQDFIDYNKTTFVDGILYLKHDMSLVTGTVKTWYDNGQLKHQGNWKDGKKDGVGKTWYPDGLLRFESNWKDGNFDGVHRAWWPDGQLWYEWNFKDNKQISEKEWDKDGRRIK